MLDCTGGVQIYSGSHVLTLPVEKAPGSRVVA